MSTATSLKKDEFVDQVAAGLSDLSQEDRDEVLEDLRAHLAEMDEAEIEANLGTPESFVSEFRASAGLDTRKPRRRRGRLARLRKQLEAFDRHLAEATRWHTIRPIWVWIRGWLLVSAVAVLTQPVPFERFPLPSINGQWMGPLFMIVAATWFSLWLDRSEVNGARLVSLVFSTATVLFILGSMLVGTTLTRPGYSVAVDYPTHFDALTGPDGEPIYNIYPFDLEGNPVEVLLFDQDGRPVQSMSSWVYDEANFGNDPAYYADGLVSFRRDANGWLITNLYPLETFDVSGRPLSSPGLALPQLEDGATSNADALEGDDSLEGDLASNPNAPN